MEARLTETSNESEWPDRMMLSSGIDRYLRAAGARDHAQRGRLIAAILQDLRSQSTRTDWAWTEIIAAADRCLAGEFRLECDAETVPTTRGRLALRLTANLAAAHNTPPRDLRIMPPQDLSLWRPSAAWLRQLQFGRPAQSLAGSLCWLAVVFIP